MTRTPGTNQQPFVVVDADALLALANDNDLQHSDAVSLSNQLASLNAHVLSPTTAITEAVTSAQRKFNNPRLATAILDITTEGKLNLESVDEKLLKRAGAYFRQSASKRNTLFDAIVASVAEKYAADAIFSFDKWYEKLGFTLVQNLF